ncbi:HNH endonuclease [Amycolatopsis sp. NPDC004625]|uniref:HNH endonuclease n=1 Tax=Amycolatopsis sp. NPDC004625 TaxID=3154670 RepID=UPI0033A47143
MAVETPCKRWEGGHHSQGYGVTHVDGEPVLAHRAAWLAVNGPIPDGKILLNRCENRDCVEVTHWVLGTQSDRMHEFIAAGKFDGGHLRPPTPEERARGERIHTAKLAAEDIPAIRQRARSGESHRAIARDYDVSRPTVSYAVRGETWAHIPDLLPPT